jgi:hypothetical protein
MCLRVLVPSIEIESEGFWHDQSEGGRSVFSLCRWSLFLPNFMVLLIRIVGRYPPVSLLLAYHRNSGCQICWDFGFWRAPMRSLLVQLWCAFVAPDRTDRTARAHFSSAGEAGVVGHVCLACCFHRPER